MTDRPAATSQQRARWDGAVPRPGKSEYSWGPGLVPPGLENSPPSQGGMYKGMAPPVDMTAASVRSAARARRRMN